jgi:chaperonin cofactor prefoldin
MKRWVVTYRAVGAALMRVQVNVLVGQLEKVEEQLSAK